MNHLQPGDLYITEGRETPKLVVHPHPETGYSTVSLDYGHRTEFRGYFPDSRRTNLIIFGKRYPVQMFQEVAS